MSALKEANRKYFDSIADTYDNKPFFVTVNQKVTDHLRANLDWVGVPFVNTGSSLQEDGKEEDVRMLDYACGTGFLSRVFGPYVTVTRGIDVTPNMVQTYNARASAASLPPSTMHAVEGDLLDKADPNPAHLETPEWTGFDLVAAGFAFHHFDDVVHAARRLKERLRPGGVLLISDFLEGGDLLADEKGEPVEGSEGAHAAVHHHHHHHHHGHGHGHGHHHQHGNKDDEKAHSKKEDEFTEEMCAQMSASVVTPHFTREHVRRFFEDAGFADVDVVTMKERVYMEFGGAKLWRTVLFGRGRRPLGEGEEGKSEL